MTEPEHPTTESAWTEALLAEVGWIRRLARRLVRGEGEAEDLTQSVLTMALEQRPPRRDGLRGWLSVATRRLARRWRRNGAQRPEPLDDVVDSASANDPAQVAERLELHRWLVAQLIALPEPYRSVLVARHVDDQSIAQIAAARGMSLAAARKQLSRGTALLRERLEASPPPATSGGWRAGLLLVAAMTPQPAVTGTIATATATTASPAPLFTGLALMNAKLTLGLAAALVLVLCVVWFATRTDAEPGSEAARVTADSVKFSVTTPRDVVAEPPANPGRDPAIERADASLANLDLIVVDAHREPLAGVAVALFADNAAVGTAVHYLARTDGDGRARWNARVAPPTRGPLEWKLFLVAEGRPPQLSAFHGPLGTDRREVRYGGTGFVEGVVELHPDWREAIHPGDAALPSMLTVSCGSDPLPLPVREWLCSEGFGDLSCALAYVEPASGAFRFEGLEGDEWNVGLPQDSPFLVAPESSAQGNRIDVARGAAPLKIWVVPTLGIRGRLVFDDGEPVPGTSVQVTTYHESAKPKQERRMSAESDRDGGFLIGLAPNADSHRWLDRQDPPRLEELTVRVQHDAACTIELHLDEFDSKRIVDLGDLRLERLPRLHVHAIDEAGQPIAGIVFSDGKRRSQPTNEAGRTSIACAQPDAMRTFWAGSPVWSPGDWMVGEYEATDGRGSSIDPLCFVIRPANSIVIEVEGQGWTGEDTVLVLDAPESFFAGDEGGVYGPRESWSRQRRTAEASHLERHLQLRTAGLRTELHSILPGLDFELRAYDRRGVFLTTAQATTPAIGTASTVRLSVPNPVCEIRGRILRATTGSWDHATVYVSPIGRDRPHAYFASTKPNADGDFRIRVAATGDSVILRVTHPDHLLHEETVELQPGRKLRTIQLERAYQLVLRAEMDGRIVPADFLIEGRSTMSVASRTDGSQELGQLPAGPLTFVARYAGRAFERTVDPATHPGPLLFDLPEPEMVAVRFDERASTELVHYVQARHRESGEMVVGQFEYRTGTWQPAAMPLYPGTYDVTCRRIDGQQETHEWVIVSGDRAPRWVMR